MEVSTKPLASEIYDDLKKSIKFRDRLINAGCMGLGT